MTNESDWQSAVQTAVSAYGKLDILLNNAGILIRKNIEETTVEDWDRIFAVNSKGVFLGTKAAIPVMRENGGGSIINISSTAGLVGSPNGSASYTATKGSVRLFTKSTAIQHARDGIRCNSIHPGPIETDMIADTLNDPDNMALRMQRLPWAVSANPVKSPTALSTWPLMSLPSLPAPSWLSMVEPRRPDAGYPSEPANNARLTGVWKWPQ